MVYLVNNLFKFASTVPVLLPVRSACGSFFALLLNLGDIKLLKIW